MQAPEAPDSGASLSHTQMCALSLWVWGLSRVESMVPAESAAWETFPGSRLEAEPGSAVPPPGALHNHGNSASQLLPDSLIPCQGSRNFLQAWGGGSGGQADLE